MNGERRVVPFVTVLRMLAATASAMATGALRLATGTAGRSEVDLHRGDRAPEFELPGSDGCVYRLSEIISHGHAVVLAWFPKAFTGG